MQSTPEAVNHVIKTVCAFCGSGGDGQKVYTESVDQLADEIVGRDIKLVYGGARVGLMQTLADGVLARGGLVEGVMPRALVNIGRAHPDLSALHVVDSMHQRKEKMMQLSDAFIVMPGGSGTLDEFFDVWTGAYVGLLRKPIGLCNTAGFYDKLLSFFDFQVEQGFMSQAHRDNLYISTEPGALLEKMAGYRFDNAGKIYSEQVLISSTIRL